MLLAHGAGAPMDSEFMNQLANALCAAGIVVVRFEFPYMAERRTTASRRPPSPFVHIVNYYQSLLDRWCRDDLPLFVAGKSMGGRAAASLVAPQLRGALAYGYPLHPAAKPESLRLEPLLSRQTPLCIIQGERDKLGDRARFEAEGPWQGVSLVWLPDGDHDLKPRKRSGYTHPEHITRAAAATRSFIEQQLTLC